MRMIALVQNCNNCNDFSPHHWGKPKWMKVFLHGNTTFLQNGWGGGLYVATCMMCTYFTCVAHSLTQRNFKQTFYFPKRGFVTFVIIVLTEVYMFKCCIKECVRPCIMPCFSKLQMFQFSRHCMSYCKWRLMILWVRVIPSGVKILPLDTNLKI